MSIIRASTIIHRSTLCFFLLSGYGRRHVHAIMHTTNLRIDLNYLLLNRVVADPARQHATDNAALVISIRATLAMGLHRAIHMTILEDIVSNICPRME